MQCRANASPCAFGLRPDPDGNDDDTRLINYPRRRFKWRPPPKGGPFEREKTFFLPINPNYRLSRSSPRAPSVDIYEIGKWRTTAFFYPISKKLSKRRTKLRYRPVVKLGWWHYMVSYEGRYKLLGTNIKTPAMVQITCFSLLSLPGYFTVNLICNVRTQVKGSLLVSW